MKQLLIGTFIFAAVAVQAQQSPPPAASLSEVQAGTVRNKYVSPYTLAQSGGPVPLTVGQENTLVNAVTNGDTRNLTLNGTNLIGGVFTNGTFYGLNYSVGPTFGLYYKLADKFSTYDTATSGKIADVGGLWNGYGSLVYDNNGNYGAGNGAAITNVPLNLGAGLQGSNGAPGAWMLVMDGSGKLGTNGIPTGGGGSGNVASNSVATFSLVNSTNAGGTNSFTGTIQAGQIVATNLFALGSSTNGYFVLYTNSGVIYAVWYQTNFPAGGGGSGSGFPLSANVSAGGYAIGNIGGLVVNGGNGITITNGGINWNGIAGVNGGDLLYVDGSRTLTWSPGANTDGSHAAFFMSCYPYARIRSSYSGSGGSGSGGAVELDTDINGGWESTGKMGAQAGFQFGNTNGVTGTIAIQTNASGPHGINLLFSGGILTSNTTY